MYTSCSNARAALRAGGALAGLLVAGLAGRAAAQNGPAAGPAAAAAGDALYQRWCSGCHGDKGAGDGFGATFMLPRPRDLTLANFHIRSTRSGDLPTDADLRRAITDGLPGTAMGAWKDVLAPTAIDTLVRYVKTLSPFFSGPAPSPIAMGPEPAASAEGLAEGRRVYQQLKCAECHGAEGRGDGTSVPTLLDDQKIPIRATDLSRDWLFRGGGSVAEIYKGFRTGLNGTPMPAFTAEANKVTDEELWRLAQYVRSLSPAEPPDTLPMIHAVPAGGPLPTLPDDAAWGRAPAHYVPLGGQVIVKPRWFAPNIDGMWVQAMYDDRKLAIKLTWHDPSRSPDPAFDPWIKSVAATMEHADAPPATTQGPDRVALTFPTQIGADSLRPHFLGGSSTRAAYMWRWSSAPDAAEEGTSRGLARFVPLAAGGALSHAARYASGAWEVQFTRAFLPADTTLAPAFGADRAIPIAFFAADGSNGEIGTRGSMSGWYTIMLHPMAASPPPAGN